MNNYLVEQFCTPPVPEETDFDKRAYAGAKCIDIESGHRILKAYSLGSGKTVLLVHGWSSRASHLSLLAKSLAKNNFHIVVFDGPAHGASRNKNITNDTSSMFEFGKAISCVARKFGDIYAVIGHSLGALAAGLTVAGTGWYADYRIAAERLVLISAPASLSGIITGYCHKRGEPGLVPELTQSLEDAFGLEASGYNLHQAMVALESRVLLIHDEQDEEVPVVDSIKLQEAGKKSEVFLTTGYGHKKILISREVFRAINTFLSEI